MVNTKAARYTLSRGLWGQQRTNTSGLILACFRLSNAYASVSPILANWGSGTRSGLAAKSSSPLLVVGSAMFACRHICPFLRRASIILGRTASDGTTNTATGTERRGRQIPASNITNLHSMTMRTDIDQLSYAEKLAVLTKLYMELRLALPDAHRAAEADL